MKNFICTGKGFIKSSGFSQEKLKLVIDYTDKIRNAQTFSTKNALNFLRIHNIIGFVWKPYEQEPIRDMYVVEKRCDYFNNEPKDSVMEWIVEKAFMVHESDINFLMSKKLQSEDMMTFEEAKIKATKLNQEMMKELNDKIKDLMHFQLNYNNNEKIEKHYSK